MQREHTCLSDSRRRSGAAGCVYVRGTASWFASECNVKMHLDVGAMPQGMGLRRTQRDAGSAKRGHVAKGLRSRSRAHPVLRLEVQ